MPVGHLYVLFGKISFQLLCLFFLMIFIYLAVLGLHCSTGFSLVAEIRGCSSLLCPGFALWSFLVTELGSRALRLQ